MSPILSLKIIEGVAVVSINDPDSKVNILNSKLLSEFEEILFSIGQNLSVKAAVLISSKPGCFIAGADIAQLQKIKDVNEGIELSRGAQKLLNRISQSKKPFVAAINGSCLGGGLETVLACHCRIATEDEKTTLALPEVKLGLLPAAGGTQRLPRLVGIQAALDMELTGKNIRPEKARKMGLVDQLVKPQDLEKIAIETAKGLAEGKIKIKPREKKLLEKILEGTPITRAILFGQARKMVMKQTRGLYPAPLAILDVIKNGINKPIEKGLEFEAEQFGRLTQTQEAKSLIGIFFGQTTLKKNRFGKPEKSAEQIGVLGAGFMGTGISLVSIQKGMRILLKDISTDILEKGKKEIEKEVDKKVKRKIYSSGQKNQVMGLLNTQTDYSNFNNCSLVIEAVFEDLNLKHKIVKEVEEHIPGNCVFASNTSALPIADIASVSKRPQNVLGMHYFSPVHKMPLLEIIVTEKTAHDAKALAVDAGLRQGKTVIVVKDGPGFYTSRILAPFMDEAIILALEGTDLYKLDSSLKKFGYPVGPITLMDEVGIDVAFHVAQYLGKALGERVSEADPKFIEEMIFRKFFGRKAGKGFFLYDKKKKGKKPVNPVFLELLKRYNSSNGAGKSSLEEIQQRVALRMVNEAIICLQEGILDNTIDGDMGAVFGLGFPPFLGGPFRYVDYVGAEKIVGQLNRLADRYGKRFKPASQLVEMAKTGKKFY